MSILYSFDSESEAIINPAETVQPVQDFPETVLSVFSEKFVHLLASSYRLEQVSYIWEVEPSLYFALSIKGSDWDSIIPFWGAPLPVRCWKKSLPKAGTDPVFSLLRLSGQDDQQRKSHRSHPCLSG